MSFDWEAVVVESTEVRWSERGGTLIQRLSEHTSHADAEFRLCSSHRPKKRCHMKEVKQMARFEMTLQESCWFGTGLSRLRLGGRCRRRDGLR